MTEGDHTQILLIKRDLKANNKMTKDTHDVLKELADYVYTLDERYITRREGKVAVWFVGIIISITLAATTIFDILFKGGKR